MRHHKILTAALCALICTPALAVLSEKDLGRTLAVLREELRQTWEEARSDGRQMSRNSQRQHDELVKTVQRSNELALMLYSLKDGYTFDQTYALSEVTGQYDKFSKDKLPFQEIASDYDTEIDRYTRLIQALRRLPPAKTGFTAGNLAEARDEILSSVSAADSLGAVADSLDIDIAGAISATLLMDEGNSSFSLDAEGQATRDSCLRYSEELLRYYRESKASIVTDSTYYAETAIMLRNAYDYAQERYAAVQESIFRDGGENYFSVIGHFGRSLRKAVMDARDKYATFEGAGSEWRGPVVVAIGAIVLFYLLFSIVITKLILKLLKGRLAVLSSKGYLRHDKEYQLLIGVAVFTLSLWAFGVATTIGILHMALTLLVEFAWMLAAILISLIIRIHDTAETRRYMRIYVPVIAMYFLTITFRIISIPDSAICIVFPPLMLLFAAWQLAVNRRNRKGSEHADIAYGWVSLAVMAIATVLAWCGYVFLGLQTLIWWTFQLTLILTIQALYDLFRCWYDSRSQRMTARYRQEHPHMPASSKEDYIHVRWPYDFMRMAAVPSAYIWSVPIALLLASKVFDLSAVVRKYFTLQFMDIEGYLRLSVFKILIVITLYFIFRFLIYAWKAFFRLYRIRSTQRRMGTYAIHESDLNLGLSNNVISILGWGIYLITLFVLFKIPTSAISVVTAGLAAGLGFAMKDILNNLFYGIQLMGGRLRVGDQVECDGIRGKVDSVSYQTTEIQAEDGSVIAFSNATLFSKNFKNLTKNHSYELLKIEVGVAYGVDVQKAREVITAALEPLREKDKFGRDIVRPDYGIQVRLMSFGDSCVNLAAYLYTTVDTHYSFAAAGKEAIYNALNANGIEIPFPQRDVYVKALPAKEE